MQQQTPGHGVTYPWDEYTQKIVSRNITDIAIYLKIVANAVSMLLEVIRLYQFADYLS